jgi:ELWxxDGT repeat protein
MKRTSMCLLATICLASFAYAQVPEIINNDLIVYNIYKACIPADSIYYFAGHDGDYDNELWRTNGTPEWTYRVANVNQGGPANPNEFTMVGGQLFFLAADDNGTDQLYKSDGTAEGTERVFDVDPDQGELYHMLTAAGGLLYFRTSRPVVFRELWVSDGTTENTHMVADICGDKSISYPHELTEFEGSLVFIAEDCEHAGGTLYRTEGLNGSVVQIGGRQVAGLMVAGDHLYFHSFSEDYGSELSTSMGGSFDVTRISDIYPGEWGADIYHITQVDSLLFFRAYEPDHGAELWSYSLNSATDHLVKDINPGASNSSFPDQLIAFHDRLYFSASDGVHGEELWVSDGTEEGTYMLRNINEEPAEVPYHSYPGKFFVTEDLLYFMANDGVHGAELWQTDGTSDGTVMTADIWPSGYEGSDPGGFAEVGDYLIFNSWYGKRTLFRLKIHNTSTMDVENSPSEPSLFRIYPNPAHAFMYMEPCMETGFRYQVYDLSGREVMNGRLLDAGRVSLDVSQLPPGLCMLRASNTDSCQTARFAVR